MAARPIPPHGTYARANGSPGYREPCHCGPCTTIKRRSNKRWKVNSARGVSSNIDATAARQHLALLRETHPWASIATASRLAESGLLLIANGQRTTIHVRTHNRILAVQPLRTPLPSTQINALGCRRRIQALMVIGLSARAIADDCKVNRHRIHDIAVGLQTTVRIDTAERIAATYERLAFRPPAASRHTARVRNHALAQGWHGPLAWDDIDDPNEQPEVEPKGDSEPSREELAAIRRHEIAHLISFNLSHTEIASRLDMAPGYVRDIARSIRNNLERAA